MKRKGIILAGGDGTRLYPATISISKQLMPVYDKPLIYYPLSTLMKAGIDDILIITTPRDKAAFQSLLKDGTQWGINITWAIQPKPDGLAQALIIAKEFLNGAPCALILGDNLFFGTEFEDELIAANNRKNGATVFGYHVKDPERYGVAEIGKNNSVIGIEEKPENPKSNYAITGLYLYDSNAPEYAKTIKPSKRGELEITTLNQIYLNKGQLNCSFLNEGTTWLDTGTHESLLNAAKFVHLMEERQGRRISSPEIIAFQKGWINKEQTLELAEPLKKSGYGEYIYKIVISS